MFIESFWNFPTFIKITKSEFIERSRFVLMANKDLIKLKKEHETSTMFLNRIMPAFVIEGYIAEYLGDTHYSSRVTDTLDWNSFSWDVLDVKTGGRIEVKCTNNPDLVVTFADYSMNNKLFAFDGESNKVVNTIHIDNFVHPESKSDVLLVVSYKIIDGDYRFYTRFIGERLTVLKGYNNNGPSLFCKSKFKNGGLYIQGHTLTIPEWVSKKVIIPRTKVFTSD